MTDHSKEKHGHQHEHRRREEAARHRPFHRSPMVWLVVGLMLIGMFVYLRTIDFQYWPGQPAQPPVPAAP